MLQFLKSLFANTNTANLEKIIQDGAFLVDVRTPQEFISGSVKGAVNIPLDTLPARLQAFKNKQNIIVFCRSGNRSGQAKSILEKNSFTNVTNGGTWQNVKQFVKK